MHTLKSTVETILVISILLTSCRQSHRNLQSIELSFLNDTTEKAECFSDFFKFKLKRFQRDTILSRITFPFTLATMIKGTDDWGSRRFNNIQELTSSDKYEYLMTSLYKQLKLDRRFDSIFATKGRPERSLKISRITRNNRFIYARFVTINGKWFIRSFQEIPVFDDGGIPIEED